MAPFIRAHSQLKSTVGLMDVPMTRKRNESESEWKHLGDIAAVQTSKVIKITPESVKIGAVSHFSMDYRPKEEGRIFLLPEAAAWRRCGFEAGLSVCLVPGRRASPSCDGVPG